MADLTIPNKPAVQSAIACTDLFSLMEYHGKLYGKVGRRQIPLTLTSDDVDRMTDDLATAKKLIAQYLKHRGHVAEELIAEKMEAFLGENA